MCDRAGTTTKFDDGTVTCRHLTRELCGEPSRARDIVYSFGEAQYYYASSMSPIATITRLSSQSPAIMMG